MICCVGLLAGFFVGQAMGGIWVFAAPGIGFVAGLAVDRKLMHKMHPSSDEIGEADDSV